MKVFKIQHFILSCYTNDNVSKKFLYIKYIYQLIITRLDSHIHIFLCRRNKNRYKSTLFGVNRYYKNEFKKKKNVSTTTQS